ncbi:MAG: D-hexose-6-phosphate mutarotase [Planctomyces sp.]|nr:D-hexose-6-phosphate mutarotase [Planctomyces sp.]
MTESEVTPDQLNSQFACSGLRFEYGPGQLIRGIIDTPAARGEFYLNGAHVTAWQPAGHQPVLWMSTASQFVRGKPIRGGIPLCYPWFGPNANDPAAPAHGWARLSQWNMISVKGLPDGGISVTLELDHSPYHLTYQIDFGGCLRVCLTTDSSTVPSKLTFEEALHTYFTIGDIHRIKIEGLEGVSFINKVPIPQNCAAEGQPIVFTGETDRVYINTTDTCHLTDPVMKRRIMVEKSGSQSTVIWNPWIAKSAKMQDFGDYEWPGMVCIETANAANNLGTLEPGESHSITALIRVQSYVP